MIAIIDYGMGNLRSVEKGFEKVGAKVIVTRDIAEIRRATGVVLPGVGAFKDCMDNLKKFNLVEIVKESVLVEQKPFLGICLGLQLLFSHSEEGAGSEGLGIFEGKVKKFEGDLKIPHMGWNQVSIKKDNPLFVGIEDETYFYFVHSYYVAPEDENIVLTETNYGGVFVSSVWRNNIFATQFHPEKSQDSGLKILENFSRNC